MIKPYPTTYKHACTRLLLLINKCFNSIFLFFRYRQLQKNGTVFTNKWNYPTCADAIHEKHINIQPPANSGIGNYNYKGFLVLCCLLYWMQITIFTYANAPSSSTPFIAIKSSGAICLCRRRSFSTNLKSYGLLGQRTKKKDIQLPVK